MRTAKFGVMVKVCIKCKKEVELKVNRDQMNKYQDGASVKEAFPHFNAGERELLISGFCNTCFDNLFVDE